MIQLATVSSLSAITKSCLNSGTKRISIVDSKEIQAIKMQLMRKKVMEK